MLSVVDTIQFINGCYVGECQLKMDGSGKFPHGFGTLTTNLGQEYVGDMKYDKKDGKGTCKFQSGATYTGEWSDDQRNGFGVDTLSNGDIFEGQYLNMDEACTFTTLEIDMMEPMSMMRNVGMAFLLIPMETVTKVVPII